MASNFPTSLDSASEQPSPVSGTGLDDAGFEHDVVHANHSTALIAVETKLGIGAAAATGASSGEVLTADGSGGSSWAAAGGSVTTSDTAPGSPSNGDLWYESDTGDLFVFTDSVWVEVGHATDGGTALADADGDTMIQVEEGTDDDTIRFDTAGTERMVISAAGYVTTSNQPSFDAYKSGAAWTMNTTNGAVSFDSTRHNIGSHFNTSTYRFTAPVAGNYLFTYHFFMHTSYDNDTDTYMGFHKNGSSWLTTCHGVEGQDGGQAMSSVISLAVNDYVTVQMVGGGSISSYGGAYNSFTGHLLG